MNRRTFLASTVTAGVAPALFGQTSKLKVDAYSRHLQWLRTPDEVAEAALEMGYDGLDITVRPFPGHVQPDRAATELAPFVNAIRKHGLRVDSVALTNILDADAPNLEQVLQAASQLGIHYYWGLGTYRYEANKPVMAQLDAIKPRLAKIAALNAKYGMTGLYHTYSGNSVGAGMWDLLYVLRDFDPAHIGIHYDAGHMTNAGGNGTWVPNLRAADRYIKAVSVKDSILEPAFPQPAGGGPFAGAPAAQDGGGKQGKQQGKGKQTENAPPRMRVRYTPLGMGNVELVRLAEVLKEIKFSGPVEIQAEYPNGGAEDAHEAITLPRALVLGAMKRDLLVLRAAFGPVGLL